MNLIRKVISRISEKSNWPAASLLMLLAGLLLSFLALLSFVNIADEVLDNDISDFDDQVATFFRQNRTQTLTWFMLQITQLGSGIVCTFLTVIISGLLLLLNERWASIFQISFVLIITGILNRLLKFSFSRPRPEEFFLISEESWSFPSGHAMTAVAFYGFIIFLIWRRKNKLRIRLSVSLILVLLILLIGASRIYLGVHYPSDVLAGYAAGLFWLLLSSSIFNWAHNRKKSIA